LTQVLFSHTIAKIVFAFAPSWREFKHSIVEEDKLLHVQSLVNSCFHFVIATELGTCLLCFICPNSGVDGPAVPSETTSVCAMWDCIVMLQDHASWQTFKLLKEHLRGYWFHKNREMEMAVC